MNSCFLKPSNRVAPLDSPIQKYQEYQGKPIQPIRKNHLEYFVYKNIKRMSIISYMPIANNKLIIINCLFNIIEDGEIEFIQFNHLNLEKIYTKEELKLTKEMIIDLFIENIIEYYCRNPTLPINIYSFIKNNYAYFYEIEKNIDTLYDDIIKIIIDKKKCIDSAKAGKTEFDCVPEEYISIQGGKLKSKKPSPNTPAKNFKIGQRKKGNDGKFWKVTQTKAGVLRWTRI